jgi:hypothetical protein
VGTRVQPSSLWAGVTGVGGVVDWVLILSTMNRGA